MMLPQVFTIAAFDVGKKNTGYVHMQVNITDASTPVFSNITTALIDVSGDSYTETTKKLYAELCKLPSADIVLCERQPVRVQQAQISTLLAGMSAQILYHFANAIPPAAHVEFVSAKSKDTVTIDSGNEVSITGGTSTQKYTSRKKHSVHNFKVFLSKHNLTIPNYKKMDDISDAFMHIYAWLIRNKYIVP